MLRALIVDDEMIVRVGLMSCIKWEDWGYQVVGACESGEEALSLMDDLEPDVVFTDIKMPGMDGLELVEHLRRRYPRVKIVVLSCLNEIDCVKRAIRLGAEDYILKLSLTPQTLTGLLVTLREKVEQEGERRQEESGELQAFEREQAYRMLLAKTTFPQQREKLLEKLGLGGAEQDATLLACCLVDNYQATRTRSALEEDYLVTYALLNVMREFLADAPFAEAVPLSEREYLVLMRGPGLAVGNLEAYARRLNGALQTHLNSSVSVGIPDSFQDARQLPQQYETARFLAGLRFFYGGGSVITQEKMEHSGSQPPAKGLPQLLQQAVDRLDQEAAVEQIRRWFQNIREHQAFLLPQSVKAAVVQAWVFVAGFGSSALEEGEVPTGEEDLFSALWNAETLEALEERLTGAVRGLMDILGENQSSHPAIASFKWYLAEHVGENISLAQAAAHCCLSKTYFCTLFKKETGESFVDYFSRLKMERARHLLLAGGMKVYEAGNAVGIGDMSYFNKLFRKYYGCSPGQMKTGKQEQGAGHFKE